MPEYLRLRGSAAAAEKRQVHARQEDVPRRGTAANDAAAILDARNARRDKAARTP